MVIIDYSYREIWRLKVENCETIRMYYLFPDLEGTVADQETKLTTTEENIQGKNIIYDIMFFNNRHIETRKCY